MIDYKTTFDWCLDALPGQENFQHQLEFQPVEQFDSVAFVTNFDRPHIPFRPCVRHLHKGEVMAEGFRPLICDILMEQDVAIPLRDGVKIYADIYRPETDNQNLPILLAWAAYGKQGSQYIYALSPDRAHIRKERCSGLDTFEGPDPAYWVYHGYAVVNVDPRGAVNSEGDRMCNCGYEEAKDVYDAIEYLASLPWCSGKVGMAGNSWLAMTQFFAAAQQPPHLAAIAPWEGETDSYRDLNCRGGIPCPEYYDGLLRTVPSNHVVEQIGTMVRKYPFMNDYWEKEKRVDFDKITVPAYVVSSWTSNIHVYGTLRAWKLIRSKEKWLRIHNTQEWFDQHTPKYRTELRHFFDRFLKDKDNDWESTPRARVSLLDPTGPDLVNLPVADFPIPETQYTRLYLDCDTRTLSLTEPDRASCISYAVGEQKDGQITFTFVPDQDLYLCGYFRSHIVMSTDRGNDIDLFMYVNKVDETGLPYYHEQLGADFKGAQGRLRASHRKIVSREPYDFRHEHLEEQLLSPGEKVVMETGFWPNGLLCRAGEPLVLTLSACRLQDFEMPLPPVQTRNVGNHTIYSGGGDVSYLEIPLIPKDVLCVPGKQP